MGGLDEWVADESKAYTLARMLVQPSRSWRLAALIAGVVGLVLTTLSAGCGVPGSGVPGSGPAEQDGPLRERVATDKHDGDYWLENAGSDHERFKLLQTYLRGFDQPMWEVGERYERMAVAIRDNNPDLAHYHWTKIRQTMEGGLIKRPRRAASANALFLDTAWAEVEAELKTRDPARMRAAWVRAGVACQSCHQAENVAWMSNQPLFRDDPFR
jgi:hypothetical protein